MRIDLLKDWKIFQDVNETAEALGVYREDFDEMTDLGNQISEWEALPELKQLQLLYADNPYFGRALRYFNAAPWWYKREFELEKVGSVCRLHFTNADYYCKVWLNGVLLGEHEGYSSPFAFDIAKVARAGKNTLIVKVSSPWETTIDGNRIDRRTYMVVRNMVKGTYEHSDTFVQRDVNPVGLYGQVWVESTDEACFEDRPDVTYALDAALCSAEVTVKFQVLNADGVVAHFSCRDRLTKETVCEAEAAPGSDGTVQLSAKAKDIRLWNTWDKGGAWLYEVRVWLTQGQKTVAEHQEATGFRQIEMLRDEHQTVLMLNGRRLYVRGTSYFPDVYVSNMHPERYKRDLLAIKAAGFNVVRVHVHVGQDIFYDLCSEIGLGIMQDSEYNWMHPTDDDFAARFIGVYLSTVKLLKRHAAMLVWICMNEPGLEDPMGRTHGRAMTVNPGPALYDAVRALDPSRPAIKGSFCEDDLTSGDSHNYTGSLNGDEVHYSQIFGTTEKLNTEYGFDAPPCLENLKKCPEAFERLNATKAQIDEIQAYQYALLKYYTEHYRMQKYAPNAGYVQFLFNDLCPQSFYGLFDYWGLPKKGLDAMLESNMPLGVFIRYSGEGADAIFAVNDSDDSIENATVEWVLTDKSGQVIEKGSADMTLGADAIVAAHNLDIQKAAHDVVNVALILRKGNRILATNYYDDLFNMPEHVKGHPSRISHETGMRLYFL
jgi:beta-mannosidase